MTDVDRILAGERLNQAVRLMRDVLSMHDTRREIPGLLAVIHAVETMADGLGHGGTASTKCPEDRTHATA